MELYLHFILTMARSPGFGSMATDFNRAVNTRFRSAFGTQYLKLASYYNSPDRSTKSTTPPVNGLCLLVSTRFQVLFHSPPGVLFTFPSRYCSTIGHQVVFRLGGWSPRLPTGFLVPRGTLDPAPVSFAFGYMALTFSGGPSQTLLLANSTFPAVRNPKHIATFGLASSDFARHYSRNLV